jgi:hypothetical protein
MQNAVFNLPSISVETIIKNIQIKVIFPKSAGGKSFVYKARIPKLVIALIA